MFMPTVGFMRSMALDEKCQACGCRYWGAMESGNGGVCGRCMMVAYPHPMRAEPIARKSPVRSLRPALSFLLGT
jgi:hypothetical protein